MPPTDLEARKAYAKAWKAAHKERLNARSREIYNTNENGKRDKVQRRYQQNRAARLAQRRAFYAAHRDRLRAEKRAYTQAHPEEIAARGRRYRSTNADKVKERHQHWLRNNRARVNEIKKRRRARKASAPKNDLSLEQWNEIQRVWNYQCAYCGNKPARLEKDHVTPLSKGGSHTVTNIVPACRSCNARKHAGAPLIPVQPLLLTTAPATKKAS